MRLDAEADAIMARAREEARRRGHAEVRPEHVMSALFGSVAVWSALVELAIDVKELKERVETSLTRIEEVGGYRGASFEPPLGAELEEALARASALPTIPLLSRVRPVHLFYAVLATRGVAELVLALRTSDDSVDAVVTRARALAVVCGHAELTTGHLLRVLLDTTAIADAVVRAGPELRAASEADAARRRERLEIVRRGVDDALSHRARPNGWADTSDAVDVVLESVSRMLRARTTSMKPRDVLALRLLQDENVVSLLAMHDVDAFDVVHLLVHGAPPHDVEPSVPPDARLEVVFHNDDITAQELVIECLVEDFELPEPDAYQLMLKVHREGTAVAGEWPAREAREKRHRAIVRARTRAAPLRITLRRPAA